MAEYRYPTTDLDRGQYLLSLLGSFWASFYQGNAVALSQLEAAARRAEQVYLDLLELAASVSRLNIPVFHTENWKLLTLLQSEKDDGYELPVFDGTENFESGKWTFGVGIDRPYHAWRLPSDLVDVSVVTNRITGASLTLTKDVDFFLQGGYIVFRDDPFENALVPQRMVMTNNIVTDYECGLWLFRGQYDHEQLYKQFGYVLGVQLTSSQAYKDLLNAVMDSIAGGTTADHIRLAWSAACGVPLAANDGEVVEEIRSDTTRKLVITDQTVYVFTAEADVLVAVGDTLTRGQPLVDSLLFFEFNRGQTPTLTDVPAIALGKGLLISGYYQDLIFENKDTPLVVETDVDGYTKLSWSLGGWPGDISQFFDDLHARGVAAGETLANLLDQRPESARTTQPTAGALPATINPVTFLCKNVLRNNAFMVVARTAGFATDAPGIASLAVLRKIVPPQTLMLVLLSLEHTEDPIRMDGAGSETAPGATETGAVYHGELVEETLSPASLTETVIVRVLGGRCT